jgi:hypothetical protein
MGPTCSRCVCFGAINTAVVQRPVMLTYECARASNMSFWPALDHATAATAINLTMYSGTSWQANRSSTRPIMKALHSKSRR